MRLVGLTLPYSRYPFERALEGIARAGYKYVGFGYNHAGNPVLPMEYCEQRLDELAKLFEAHGLTPGLLWAGIKVMGDSGVEQMKGRLDMARYLGIKVVTSSGYDVEISPDVPLSDPSTPPEHREYVRRMQLVGDYAAELGLTVIIKPHGGNTGTAAKLLKTLQDIDRPTVKAYYDPGNVHFYEGLDPAEDIRLLKDPMPALCAKDHRGGVREMDFPVPGEGDVDFKAIFSHLLDTGFDGWVSVERVDVTDRGPIDPEVLDERMGRARKNLSELAKAAGFSVIE
ncbi:MAG: sugar phosphate isomerase/epimerase [Firmicutes bacterium]|jgi:sugar phosphate isomerase/epimerase|nr:sugar phosphate isomerase/epimerase [Bacillota bacterium]